jgi:choice-of-anchor A domain-containing protein/MYXO-CTERM domain-containing protein
MSINFFKKIALLGCMTASASVMAGPLNDYNLILSGDLAISGGSGHIHGKAFIGGNVTGSNPEFGHDLNRPANKTNYTAEIAGNLNAGNNAKFFAGRVALGGTTNGKSECHGGFVNNKGCIDNVSGLDAKNVDLFSQLTAESNFYKSLASTGVVSNKDLNQSKFIYSGAQTDLAVFDISGTSLFNSNGWDAIFGSAKNIVINVSGTKIDMTHNVNLMGNLGNSSFYDNILWNFYEATSITFNNRWAGSVLAVNAVIDIKNSDFDGSVAAKSYIGNGQIHDYHWSYTPPTPPPIKVPEPSSLLLGLLGLGALLLARARRK